MARNSQKFPPQEQQSQPGKEHLMNPAPQFMNPNYKPAAKLQVLSTFPNQGKQRK